MNSDMNDGQAAAANDRAQDADTIRDVEIVVTDEELATVRAILKEEGVVETDESEEDFLEVIGIVIAAAIALYALVNVVIRLMRALSTGVEVDARYELIRVQKRPELPRGVIVIHDGDGNTHTLHEPSELDLKSLIAALGK